MLLKELINYLNEKYVIVWAYALRYYGYLRNTIDVDLLVDFTNDEFKKLENLLKQNWNQVEVRYIPEHDIEEPLGTILKCDCWWEVELIQAKYSWQKDAVKHFVIDKNGFRIVDLYYLILLKLDAHWLKDLEDIKFLLKTQPVDINKLCDILKKYNFHKKYSKLLNLLDISCKSQ